MPIARIFTFPDFSSSFFHQAMISKYVGLSVPLLSSKRVLITCAERKLEDKIKMKLNSLIMVIFLNWKLAVPKIKSIRRRRMLFIYVRVKTILPEQELSLIAYFSGWPLYFYE